MTLDNASVVSKLKSLKSALRELRSQPTNRKNGVLLKAATLLGEKSDQILSANERDLLALPSEATSAFRDRLTLNAERLKLMQESLRQVAALPDPVGEIVDKRVFKNGLKVSRVRSPLGVIFMIFESRPNVAIEAFSLAFKAGNVTILRGGKESHHTTGALYGILKAALSSESFSEDTVWGIADPDRKLVELLLTQKKWIDVVVPRGGDSLIQFVEENSRIPIIKNDRGLCHVYVDEGADLKMAASIVLNAKTERPGVCNSMETLLVHQSCAQALLPKLARAMPEVEWFVSEEVRKILPDSRLATKESWDTEYLDLKINCKTVSSLDEAIRHIEEHGSGHSEAIITNLEKNARRFQESIDAAAVYWNASTRFTDGFEMELGGELGISTQKLHVRGPVGLKELTSVRWVIDGEGQIRK